MLKNWLANGQVQLKRFWLHQQLTQKEKTAMSQVRIWEGPIKSLLYKEFAKIVPVNKKARDRDFQSCHDQYRFDWFSIWDLLAFAADF